MVGRGIWIREEAIPYLALNKIGYRLDDAQNLEEVRKKASKAISPLLFGIASLDG